MGTFQGTYRPFDISLDIFESIKLQHDQIYVGIRRNGGHCVWHMEMCVSVAQIHSWGNGQGVGQAKSWGLCEVLGAGGSLRARRGCRDVAQVALSRPEHWAMGDER